LLVQGSIDARSSRPLVKEDDVDRERRRESAEKQKSTKDLEKKKRNEEEPLAASARETPREGKAEGGVRGGFS
jgi:hypothetical protein